MPADLAPGTSQSGLYSCRGPETLFICTRSGRRETFSTGMVGECQVSRGKDSVQAGLKTRNPFLSKTAQTPAGVATPFARPLSTRRSGLRVRCCAIAESASHTAACVARADDTRRTRAPRKPTPMLCARTTRERHAGDPLTEVFGRRVY